MTHPPTPPHSVGATEERTPGGTHQLQRYEDGRRPGHLHHGDVAVEVRLDDDHLEDGLQSDPGNYPADTKMAAR